MKILVDELPYEEEECLFRDRCNHANSLWCPMDNVDDYDGDECYYYKKNVLTSRLYEKAYTRSWVCHGRYL